jgi:Transposase, Mutator family
MATPRMDITSFVGKLLEQDDVDALREGVRVLAQAVMETEVSTQIGTVPYERSSERVAYRNGYRTRRWDTRVGTIELKIPKVTAGAYFPSLLEPRRRAERALHAVVVEAYVKGVSTRKVDDLVRALGIDGISRSEVSRICRVLDEEVRAFLARQIDDPCPYLWLDATFHKVREAGRVVSVATVVAIGVTEQGDRTVLGAATGASEDHQFWTSFLRQLVKRGLKGVRLVISDAHEGFARRSRRSCTRRLGNGAGSTSCATCSPQFPSRPRTPWPRSSGRSSPSPTMHRRWTSCTRWPGCSVPSSLRWPSSWRTPPKTSSPICTSRWSTGGGCTRRTRSSACTKRSSVGPASSASSPPATR